MSRFAISDLTPLRVITAQPRPTAARRAGVAPITLIMNRHRLAFPYRARKHIFEGRHARPKMANLCAFARRQAEQNARALRPRCPARTRA